MNRVCYVIIFWKAGWSLFWGGGRCWRSLSALWFSWLGLSNDPCQWPGGQHVCVRARCRVYARGKVGRVSGWVVDLRSLLASLPAPWQG